MTWVYFVLCARTYIVDTGKHRRFAGFFIQVLPARSVPIRTNLLLYEGTLCLDSCQINTCSYKSKFSLEIITSQLLKKKTCHSYNLTI